MSGDMFTTLSEDADTEDAKHKFGRVNIYENLKKCSYTGDCKWRHSLKNKDAMCNICKHKVLHDIPNLIDEALFEKFGIK